MPTSPSDNRARIAALNAARGVQRAQIESGDISGVNVLDRYVTAIGSLLEIVANFGDDQLKVV